MSQQSIKKIFDINFSKLDNVDFKLVETLYKLADMSKVEELADKIRYSIKTIAMGKFISLKKDIPDEYSKLIKLYPNSIPPNIEVEIKKLRDYMKINKAIVIIEITQYLTLMFDNEIVFGKIMKDIFTHINNDNPELKKKYVNHYKVLQDMIKYVIDVMIKDICNLNMAIIENTYALVPEHIFPAEVKHLHDMTFSQLINEREKSKELTIKLALDDNIFINLDEYKKNTYYYNYIIDMIEKLEKTTIPELD